MEHVPDSRGMTEDTPEEAEAVDEAWPVAEADAGTPAEEQPAEPEAAEPEAEAEAPPVEVEAMDEPISKGVGVLDVPEEPPLTQVDEDEREAFGEVPAEPEPVLEAPSGDEEAA